MCVCVGHIIIIYCNFLYLADLDECRSIDEKAELKSKSYETHTLSNTLLLLIVVVVIDMH